MDNIYRGEPISKNDFIDQLSQMGETIEKDLLLPRLMPEIVIEAVHRLIKFINQEEVVHHLVSLGMERGAAKKYIRRTLKSMEKEELAKKLDAELGPNPFQWKDIGNGVEECNHPLGTILHIGAGNTLGLSAFSVIEGLLTGNINILKLPENEGGISSRILSGLVQIEPRLKPLIYVLDISSKDQKVIRSLIEIVNAVVVWGSDDAITAIRNLAPPYMPIIEWGHKLSFAYFAKNEGEDKDLEELAREICITDQLYCSSPQCVFYETDNPKEVDAFAHRLAAYMEQASNEYPPANRTIDVQAQITWTHEFISAEEILKEKKLITDDKKEYGIMIDYDSSLKSSPLFRNIWVTPIKRSDLLSILRPHKGHLQTVGLSCNKDELTELSQIFYAAGITRIKSCGKMSSNYSGEPHDGVFPLQRYVKRVNRPKLKPSNDKLRGQDMRNEDIVLDQILDFADSENKVRVVMLNGSRVNDNDPRDIMQDYDIVFFIKDIKDLSYKKDTKWIDRFGELVIMQQNDFEDNSYIFLMQFKDGVRIDLRFADIKKIKEIVSEDTLSKIILDKANIAPELQAPNDSCHYIQKPMEKEFAELLNEAWWIQTYVAKGIWRDELPFAKYMYDVILMDCIRKLLSWYIGESRDWNINVGKCGKWFKRYLPDEIYKEFTLLYPGVDYGEIWECLFRAGKFIRKIGEPLALSLQYSYSMKDDINVTEYLARVKELPR